MLLLGVNVWGSWSAWGCMCLLCGLGALFSVDVEVNESRCVCDRLLSVLLSCIVR